MKKSDQNTLWRDFVEAAFCLIVALLLLLFLSSCSEDLDQSPLAHDGGSTEETALLKNISVNVMAVRLAADSVGGTPLALISDVELGSVIRMSELDSVTLDTTGVSYMTRCTDTSGMFRFDSVTVHSPYVLLELSPWQENAYWEWDGTWSFDDDVLYSAIVDLRETKNVGINMMTYLEAIRVRYLVKQGMSFVAAKQQADREVLDAVGLFDATFDFDKLAIVDLIGDLMILLINEFYGSNFVLRDICNIVAIMGIKGISKIAPFVIDESFRPITIRTHNNKLLTIGNTHLVMHGNLNNDTIISLNKEMGNITFYFRNHILLHLSSCIIVEER